MAIILAAVNTIASSTNPVAVCPHRRIAHFRDTDRPDRRTIEDNLYEEYHKADIQRARLFTIGAVLAILIGCIGLYGLAAFDTSRRVKEIGIRKTIGASTAGVLRSLLTMFRPPVLIASIVAWPIAYIAMRRWLSGFDDRIAKSPWFFLAATVAAIVIAPVTIFIQAWRVARAKPAVALRYE